MKVQGIGVRLPERVQILRLTTNYLFNEKQTNQIFCTVADIIDFGNGCDCIVRADVKGCWYSSGR